MEDTLGTFNLLLCIMFEVCLPGIRWKGPPPLPAAAQTAPTPPGVEGGSALDAGSRSRMINTTILINKFTLVFSFALYLFCGFCIKPQKLHVAFLRVLPPAAPSSLLPSSPPPGPPPLLQLYADTRIMNLLH